MISSLSRRYKFSAPFFKTEHPITNLAFAESLHPRNDLIIYATTESTVRSFRLIQTPLPLSPMSTAVAMAATVTSTLTSLRDRRLPIGQHHQPPAQFNITELETNIGCAPGCAVLAKSEFDNEQQFVVANPTGVFSYVGEDKRLALAIEGEKLAVHWWFNYLITVTKENRRAPISSKGIQTNLPSLSNNRPASTVLNQLTAK